jgi:hypothetical protein
MKSFIDKTGKLVQVPESLEDTLELKNPILHERYEHIKNTIAHFKTYYNFFYLHPLEDERNLPVHQRTKWNGMIDYVHTQNELRKHIPLIEYSKSNDRNIMGDKAIVIQSQRPLWDVVINPQENYSANAWVGDIADYEIIDPLNKSIETNHSKIRVNIELKNAIKLSSEMLGKWVGEVITQIQFHKYEMGLENFKQELLKLQGKKSIRIEDDYENVSYDVLLHKNTPEEELISKEPCVSKINLSKSGLFNFRDGLNATGNFFEDGKFGSAFIGVDSRPLKDIRAELDYYLEKRQNSYLFIGKQILANISVEQREFVARQPSPDRPKWLNKFYKDRGLNLTDKTAICIFYLGKEQNKEEIRLDLVESAKKILLPIGYAYKGSMSAGFWGGGDMYADINDIEKGIEFVGQERNY